MTPTPPKHLSICCLTVMVGCLGGCVRRTLTIATEPQGATVTLNDEQIGMSPVSRDFTWYGDYDVIIRKKGFQTLHTNVVVKTPWYEVSPIDFFFDVLWPGHIHDRHHYSFTLSPSVPLEHNELVRRATELRAQALSDDR